MPCKSLPLPYLTHSLISRQVFNEGEPHFLSSSILPIIAIPLIVFALARFVYRFSFCDETSYIQRRRSGFSIWERQQCCFRNSAFVCLHFVCSTRLPVLSLEHLAPMYSLSEDRYIFISSRARSPQHLSSTVLNLNLIRYALKTIIFC